MSNCIKELGSLEKGGGGVKAIYEYKLKIDEEALETVKFLDSNRDKLTARNPDDSNEDAGSGSSTLRVIERSVRSEIAIANFRDELLSISQLEVVPNVDVSNDSTSLTERIRKCQQRSLQYLSDVGELLIPTFPYTKFLPPTPEYSILPKLEGRCRVSFQVYDSSNALKGNVTIIADGYTASITAGEFVDLSRRGFYEGLEIKEVKKHVVSREAIEQTEEAPIESLPFFRLSLAVLGSFNQGFIDPFTAKLRTIPLEILRSKKGETNKQPYYGTESNSVADESGQIPVVDLDVPGVVALNHPQGTNLFDLLSRSRSRGSSEFFMIKRDESWDDLLRGNYAPFGYVVEGFDTMSGLVGGDVVKGFKVDEWGGGNLRLMKRKGLGLSFGGSSGSEE